MLQQYYQEEKIRKIDFCILSIILLMILIIPSIVLKKETLSVSPVVMDNFYSSGTKTDLFNFYKSIFLYIGTAIISSLFIYKVIYLKQELKYIKLNVYVTIFIVAIAISTLFSEYKNISLLGNFDRNEGALAWVCYMSIFFILYNIKIEKKYFKYFYFVLYPFLIINSFLGIMTIYGVNVLENNIIQTIIGGKGDIGGTLWTTLYNPNFSSGICGVIFSLGFMYLLLSNNYKEKVAILIGNTLSFIIVLTSLSVSGFISIVVTLPLTLIVAWRFSDKKNIFMYSIATLVINSIVFYILNQKNPKIFKESLGIFVQINQISSLIIPLCILLFIAIIFIIRKLDKKKILNYFISIILICMTGAYLIYSFVLDKESRAIEQNTNLNIVRMQDTDLYKKLDVISSYRVTIWQETIKLINNKPLLGHGFDTFPYTLNHDKQEGVYENKTIDKPHNILLTIGYGSGIFGFIGFVGIMLYLIMKSLYSLIESKENKIVYICLIGIIAYLVQGILNDTLIGTSIIFWIICGICANVLILNDAK